MTIHIERERSDRANWAGRAKRNFAVGFLVICAATNHGMSIVPVASAQPRSATATGWTMYQGNPAHTGQSPFVGLTTFPLELWRIHLEPLASSGEKSAGMSLAANGTVYVSTSGRLFAVDPTSPSVKWTIDMFDTSRSVPAVAPSGVLYWGVGDSFMSISPDGQPGFGWVNLDGNFVFGSSPVIDSDGNIYFSHDGVWSLKPNGDLRWMRPSGSFSHSSPALSTDGTIYAAVYQAFLAIHPDGTLKWSLPVETGDNDPVVATDGTIYIGAVPEQMTGPARMLALNPDGTLRWSFLLDASTASVGMPPGLGADGTLYFGDGLQYAPEPDSAAFYAVSADGSLRWKRYFQGTGFFVKPPMIDRNDGITFCFRISNCYGLSAEGDIRWQIRFPADDLGLVGTDTVPLLIADGRMLILDSHDNLHLFTDAAAVVHLPSIIHP